MHTWQLENPPDVRFFLRCARLVYIGVNSSTSSQGCLEDRVYMLRGCIPPLGGLEKVQYGGQGCATLRLTRRRPCQGRVLYVWFPLYCGFSEAGWWRARNGYGGGAEGDLKTVSGHKVRCRHNALGVVLWRRGRWLWELRKQLGASRVHCVLLSC
jgi:hypothetical protein